MLPIKPIGGLPVGQCEIALVAKPPEDIARSLAILVVDFDHPTLVPHGHDQIAVIRRVHDGIGVRPVGEIQRMAVDIQAGGGDASGAEMVKRVPLPDRIVILPEVNKSITEHGGRAGIPRQICEVLGMVNKQDQVSIG